MKSFFEKLEWTIQLKEKFPDKGMKVLTNNEYIVEVHKTSCRWGDSIRLAIKRIDTSPIHSWSDLQKIKDEVAGEERIAIEIYPRSSEVTDTSNIYHLWVLPKDFNLPYSLIPYRESGVSP